MWTTFAAISGGASAGLTGLIFIVVGLRFDTIAVSQEHRSRAAQALILFMTSTVIAILIAIPQPMRALGGEMLMAFLLSSTVLKALDSEAKQMQKTLPSLTLMIGLVAFAATLGTSGLLLLLGFLWGMYLYVPSALLALLLGALAGWTFLTKAGVNRSETAADTSGT